MGAGLGFRVSGDIYIYRYTYIYIYMGTFIGRIGFGEYMMLAY